MPGSDRDSAARPTSPQPPGDKRRLQVLHGLRLLDTPDDERFDRVTRLAASLFDAPVALVTLLDAERQWFKSRVGTELHETPLSLSFCRHALELDGPLVIEDARQDARFADNPMVTGETAIRFYAGYPLAAPDGTRLGTLCVLDRSPRTFDDARRTLLHDLAAIVQEAIAAIDREQAAEREREQAEWMHALLEHMPDGVLMLDGPGTIMSINPAARRIFGDAKGTLVGRSARQLIVAGDLERLMGEASLSSMLAYEGTGLRADGTRFPLEFSINRLRIGGRGMVAAVVRDVSARHASDERLRAVDMRRRKQFATATHELRTPMASVVGFSELLLKRQFDAATGRELVEIIHRQATRLVDLVNQLLDLARIDAGGHDGLSIQPLSVPELMRQTLSGLEGLGESQRITLRIDDGLPPLAGDSAKLQQALTNIISNSIKYSAPGTPIALDVFEAPSDDARWLAIRVTDQGIGMTPEQQSQVFDPFYRADSASSIQGNGLGMTIFKEIVDLHGGTVTLTSALGSGTQVTVCLPVAQSAPGAAS